MKASHVLLVPYYVLLFLHANNLCMCILCVGGHVEPSPVKRRGQDRNRESDLELDARGPRGASRGSYCGSIQPLLVDSGRNGVKGAKTLLMTLLYRIKVKGSTTEPGANRRAGRRGRPQTGLSKPHACGSNILSISQLLHREHLQRSRPR